MQASGRKLKNEASGPESIDIKLCRLEKGPEGNKAYAINIQAQWDEERFMFSNRGMVLQGSPYYNNSRYCMILHQRHAACLSYLGNN